MDATTDATIPPLPEKLARSHLVLTWRCLLVNIEAAIDADQPREARRVLAEHRREYQLLQEFLRSASRQLRETAR